MGHHGKRGRHFGKDLHSSSSLTSNEPEVREHAALRTPSRRWSETAGQGSTSTQPAGQDRCEAADVKLRRCVPLDWLSAHSHSRSWYTHVSVPLAYCADECVSVKRSQRHRCAEDLPEMSLGFGDRCLH